MSWGIGWLLRLAVTCASREELHRDSELLLSRSSVNDASRALTGGETGDLNSVLPADGTPCAKLANVEEQLCEVTSPARALKPW